MAPQLIFHQKLVKCKSKRFFYISCMKLPQICKMFLAEYYFFKSSTEEIFSQFDVKVAKITFDLTQWI
jgi:hypothetical protein